MSMSAYCAISVMSSSSRLPRQPRLCVAVLICDRFTTLPEYRLRVLDGVKMLNSYPQQLSTRVKNLWDTLKSTLIIDMYLTKRLRSMLVGEPLPRLARRRSLVLMAGLLLFSNMPTSNAINTPKDINNYKLYAHIKVLDAKEYRCLELLWMLESKWDPRANNTKSSAFGIPQLLKMKELDPYKQIDLGLKYIYHRYITPCKAYAYHLKHRHY